MEAVVNAYRGWISIVYAEPFFRFRFRFVYYLSISVPTFDSFDSSDASFKPAEVFSIETMWQVTAYCDR